MLHRLAAAETGMFVHFLAPGNYLRVLTLYSSALIMVRIYLVLLFPFANAFLFMKMLDFSEND